MSFFFEGTEGFAREIEKLILKVCLPIQSVLFPNSYPVYFNQNKFSLVRTHIRIRRQIIYQAHHELWDDLWMISDLEGNDSFIIPWRIIQLIDKITV